MAKLTLSPPWVTYLSEVEALFGKDPEIKIVYNDIDRTINMFVDNPDKADAISQILKSEETFGNIKLKINVIPSNRLIDPATIPDNLYDRAFNNNPAYAFVKESDGLCGITITYVIFKNKVVQFFDDNLADYYGIKNTLYQNIAYDILNENLYVRYCTEVNEEEVIDSNAD